MAAEIRELDIGRDIERLADFFNRNDYGSIRGGVPLTADSLARVLAERAAGLVMVACDRDRIVGTIGYTRMSGRRVAATHELFAGMFVIAPSYRSGLVAGSLFTASFEKLVAMGIRSLRVEVNPANRRAYPLYVRVGFRALGDARPDEEGYIELVSLLPGVVTDLMQNAPAWLGAAVPSGRYDWRTLHGARRQSLHSGVARRADGGATIDYEFRVNGRHIVATARVGDAGLESLTVDGVPAPGFRRAVLAGTRDSSGDRVRGGPTRTIGDVSVSQDPDTGTLSVRLPGRHGPVLTDPFPVVDGTPAGARRPARRDLAIVDTADGWSVTDGIVTRTVAVRGTGIDIRVSAAAGRVVTCYPWMGLRVADLTIDTGAGTYTAATVRGRWPLDLTDFEAAADQVSAWPAAGSRAAWHDHAGGVGVVLEPTTPGLLRLEGMHAGRLVGAGAHVGYRIVVTDGSDRPVARPAVAASPPARWTRTRWTPTRRGGRPAAASTDSTSGSTVVVADDAGLVEWRASEGHTIGSTFPSRRVVGPLTDVTTALWVAVQADRTDPDVGAEWAGHDACFAFAGDAAGRSWDVTAADRGQTLFVTLRAGPERAADGELAVYFLAPGRPDHVLMKDSAGVARRVDGGPTPWRAWTRSAGIPVDRGVLWLSPVAGEEPEILLRSDTFGLLATMLSRLPRARATQATWKLEWQAGP